MASRPPILWQNADKTVILIDVPRSLSAAQDDQDHLHHPLSSAPAQRPFESGKPPKSKAARARHAAKPAQAQRQLEYQGLAEDALEQLKAGRQGGFCLKRDFVESRPSKGDGSRKRKRDAVDDEDARLDDARPPDRLLPLQGDEYVAVASLSGSGESHPGRLGDIDIECSSDAVRVAVEEKQGHRDLTVTSTTARETFRVPPNASFFLGDCSCSGQFHAFIRKQAEENGTRRKFDCMILDPPWPNRSVRRAIHSSSAAGGYVTGQTLYGVDGLLHQMDLDVLMHDDCLVGIWITNKPKVRELVLGEGGLFDGWGVVLVEEWLWLKVTEPGEPISPFDDFWRKPYEAFLLGRRTRVDGEKAPDPLPIKQRVLVSVPSLHSQKPCLKGLLEDLLVEGRAEEDGSRILELFARNLVAGWWSWGDECVKFNADRFWKASDG